MVKIIFVTNDGKNHETDCEEGLSLMENAMANNIEGIDADCGGACACATCHVYIEEDSLNALPDKSIIEESMLDMAFEPKENSRLSCQLIVSKDMEGMKLFIPSSQQ